MSSAPAPAEQSKTGESAPAVGSPPGNRPSHPHPAQDEVIVAAEEDTTDDQSETDSVLSADAQSSTASISSSILDYRRNSGRSYHSDKFALNYFCPNDDQQLESMDLTHHYLTILLDEQLYIAPIQKDKMNRVLDLGTGTGIWAIEFADQFPNAAVTGTDLSPCQPEWIPPNVRFEVDDASLDWTWDDNYFDFVHIRYLFGAIKDWNHLLTQAYRCCVPGGWVQSGECDVEFRSDDDTTKLEPSLAMLGKLYRDGGAVLGVPFFVEDLQQKAFDKAGFVEQKKIRYKIPVGGWPKDKKLAEVGKFVRATLENDLEGYTLMMWQEVMKWPKDEYQLWLASLRKAIRNPRVHSYMVVTYIYGRKPE